MNEIYIFVGLSVLAAIIINLSLKHFFIKTEKQAMIFLGSELIICFLLAFGIYWLAFGSLAFRCLIGFVCGIVLTMPGIKKLK